MERASDVALHARCNVIGLCAGGGGLELALGLAIPGARPILYVEREAFAAAHLVAAMRAGVLAEAPIWSDARTLDGRPWRGLVDGVVGGIPCQPHSLAGKRRAHLDERDLWGPARRVIVQARPWFVLVENVGGILSSGGGRRVWRDLQRLGFAVEGGLFSAAEVGAPHQRERFFILGVADAGRFRLQRWGTVGDLHRTPSRAESARDQRRNPPGDGGRAMADADEPGRAERAGPRAERGRRAEPADVCGPMADAAVARRQGRRPAGDRPGQREAAERGGGDVVDADDERLERAEPADAPGLRRRPADAGGTVVDAARVRRREGRAAPELRGRGNAAAGSEHLVGDAALARGRAIPIQQGRQAQVDADADGADGAVADADLTQLRPEPPAGQLAFLQQDDGVGLFPPGPGDVEAWRAVAEYAPGLVPAISRYDRFLIAIRAARAAADGDPGARSRLDPQGPFGLRAAVVQEVAQSTLRGVADGVAASRVDWLRLLGNGVVPMVGALAFRTLAARLAAGGSASATVLLGMMGLD